MFLFFFLVIFKHKTNMKIVNIKSFTSVLKQAPSVKFGKLMALDVGTKRIGVALSDETKRFISPLETLTHAMGDSADIQRISKHLQSKVVEHKIVGVVVGFPLDQDGEVSPLCRRILAFTSALPLVYDSTFPASFAGSPLLCTFWDERNSSVEARRMAKTLSSRKAVARKHKDTFAACLILEGFLEHAYFPPEE